MGHMERNIFDVEAGERLVVDIDPAGDRDRGVTTFDASSDEEFGRLGVESPDTGEGLGTLMPADQGSDELTLMQGQTATGVGGQEVARVNDVTVTDRRDLEPIGIGRDRKSGHFTPDNTEPAPRSSADRDPDDGEFVTPDPRPITDIGRRDDDGLFDLF